MVARLPPFIAWRNARPRFSPGPRERRLRFKPEDLKIGGRWMTFEEATKWGSDKHGEIVRARAVGIQTTPVAKRNTLADLLRDWLASAHVATLSAKTRDGYRKQVNAILTRRDGGRELIADAPVDCLEKPEIYEFIQYQIRARGLYMGRASRAVLQAAFQWGSTSSVWRLKHNPAAGLKFEKPAGRIVIYSDAEIRSLLAAADRLGRPSIGDAVLLGLFTGQRQGDRLALEDAGLLDGRRMFRQSKTSAVVGIPETPQLRERLAAAKARTALIALRRGTRPASIIVDETTGVAYQSDTYRKVFGQIRAAAATEIAALADKRDQDLRDTAVTWLARAGATLPEIASITGHSLASIHNVLKHYLAITPELADAAIAKLVAWMEREGMAV
jgi:hypothetical protein